MKKVLLFFCCMSAVCLSYTASAKSLSTPTGGEDSLVAAIPDIEDMFAEVVEIAGHGADFILRAADVQNLEASVSRRKKYISYNPEYIDWLNGATRNKWATMTLLAHEIGHHIYKHTVGKRKGKRVDLELQADQFAGEVLYKLGATVEQAQQVMRYIAKSEESSTHPGRASRLLAIKAGWNRAAKADQLAISSSKH